MLVLLFVTYVYSLYGVLLSTLILQLRLNLLIVYIGSQEYLILQKLGLWLF